MNVIVGGTDDELNNILSAARTIRKEWISAFALVEIYQNIIQSLEFIRQDIILKPRNLLYMFIFVLMSGILIRKRT